MTILVDTREQAPVFAGKRVTLPFGDYMCELDKGVLVPLVFERKSLPDLFGSLSKGYERFRKMLKKANEAEVKVIIIIEGSLKKVLKGYSRSQRTGISVIKQLYSLRATYDIEIVFCQDRVEMSQHIYHCFDAYKRLKNLS